MHHNNKGIVHIIPMQIPKAESTKIVKIQALQVDQFGVFDHGGGVKDTMDIRRVSGNRFAFNDHDTDTHVTEVGSSLWAEVAAPTTTNHMVLEISCSKMEGIVNTSQGAHPVDPGGDHETATRIAMQTDGT